MTDPAGHLSEKQLELLFRHLPIGLSLADEDDVVRFWAGVGFEVCSPTLIGSDLRACHSARAQGALEALLADLRSGAQDEVATLERGDHGSERIIYTALRDAEGTYRGVLETVMPLPQREQHRCPGSSTMRGAASCLPRPSGRCLPARASRA
jgi:DUF438 domain-containing protein